MNNDKSIYRGFYAYGDPENAHNIVRRFAILGFDVSVISQLNYALRSDTILYTVDDRIKWVNDKSDVYHLLPLTNTYYDLMGIKVLPKFKVKDFICCTNPWSRHFGVRGTVAKIDVLNGYYSLEYCSKNRKGHAEVMVSFDNHEDWKYVEYPAFKVGDTVRATGMAEDWIVNEVNENEQMYMLVHGSNPNMEHMLQFDRQHLWKIQSQESTTTVTCPCHSCPFNNNKKTNNYE